MKGGSVRKKKNAAIIERRSSNLVCGIDLSQFSQAVQLIILASGVLSFFIIYGYVQEKIFHIEGFRSHGWFLTFLQFLIVTFLSFMDSRFISRSSKHRETVPYYEFMTLSWLTVGTIGLSTVSLGYLNFPTQVIFKSCKLIPVMIGGIIILGKKYNFSDYMSVLLMCFGLVWFSLADQTVYPEFNTTGIVLITMALTVDAIFGNYQEKLMRKYPYFTNADIIFYSYSFGCFLIFTWLVATGQFLSSLQFVSQNKPVYPLTLLYSTLGYVGGQFVLALIKSAGALVCTVVTTMRKVLTVVLSFIFFTKPFTEHYVWSGSLVLLGIGITIYTRNKGAIRAVFAGALAGTMRSVQKFALAHQTPISRQEKTVLQV